MAGGLLNNPPKGREEQAEGGEEGRGNWGFAREQTNAMGAQYLYLGVYLFAGWLIRVSRGMRH